jgi:hypothetical protein
MVRHVRGRPLGIWIITILQLTLAGSLVASVTTGIDYFSAVPGAQIADDNRAVYAAWVGVTVVAAVLLWRLSRRGWALTMLLTGVSLAANLALWWNGDPYWTRLAIEIVIVFYINSASVRELFLQRQEVSRLTVRGTKDE